MQNMSASRAFGFLVLIVALVVSGMVMGSQPADAQSGQSVPVPYETCAAYGVAVGTGGQGAANAAEDLRAIGAPNPPGIETALGVLVNAEADVPPIGSRPSIEAIDAAYQVLSEYFDPICIGVDICPLIRQAVATNDGSSAEGARLARGITAPAPPGIDAALALIAGDIAESPFHNSVAEAQRQISDYFPCSAVIEPPLPVDDICTLVIHASDAVGDPAFVARNARQLRATVFPAPPGIDAALALIGGEVDASPFHDSIDAAQSQVADYWSACFEPLLVDPYFGDAPTCAAFAKVQFQESPTAGEGARELRDLGTPNPPGVEAALETIMAANGDGVLPSTSEQAAAYATVEGYFGGICADFDPCPLVQFIQADIEWIAGLAASFLSDIERPAPPGIGAALALIAGDISESPFHASVAEAKEQIKDYYPCDTFIALTGTSSTVPLTLAGIGLVSAGAGFMTMRRRIENVDE